MDLSYLPPNSQSPNTTVHGDLQDLYDLALCQTLEIEKLSIDTFVRLNSCILDSIWFAPAFVGVQEAAAQAFACCAELQMTCLNLFVPHALSYLTAPAITVEGGSIETQSAEVLERSMDIAIGVCFTEPGSLTVITPGNQASPAEEMSDSDEDAISAQAA